MPKDVFLCLKTHICVCPQLIQPAVLSTLAPDRVASSARKAEMLAQFGRFLQRCADTGSLRLVRRPKELTSQSEDELGAQGKGVPRLLAPA